jgi:hypothetical protein
MSSLVLLLTISSSCIMLLIIDQLRPPCWLIVLYCSSRWAVLILYCSLLSSCDFHVDLYSGILATPIVLWDLAAGKAAWDQTCLNIILGIDEQFLYYTAHHWAVATSIQGLSCGITAGLSDLYTAHHWAVATSMSSYIFIVANFATSTLLCDYAAMKAVWDHTRSFLRHHFRLWLRHHADFTCGITADSIRRLIGRLAASLPTWVIFILLIIEQLRL